MDALSIKGQRQLAHELADALNEEGWTLEDEPLTIEGLLDALAVCGLILVPDASGLLATAGYLEPP
jgi:hypothetical protein